MNSNRFIAILGLLLLLILAMGSISASEDVDSSSIGDDLADIDLTLDEQSVDEMDGSNVETIQDDNSNIGYDSNIEDLNIEDAISDEEDIVNDDLNSVGEKGNLKASNLESTITFRSSNYATYFDSNGNIISGKLKAGDVLDCSGSFNRLTFIINIPLTFTSTDGTAKFTNCNFKIVKGANGTNITNINATMDKLETPIIDVFNVSEITVANSNLFSNATSSYPILLNTVNSSNIINNTVKTSCTLVGYGHPSAIVLSNTFYNNISSNYVVTNDSNGIYLTGYLGGGSMGQGGGVNAYNYIFNNTVHSLRGVEWALDENGKVPLPSSFTYGIQVMGAFNDIINNTVYNVYRGIGATQTGNKIIGNTLYNIHGTWYSGNTNDEGGDYAIYATVNCLVKDNIISDSKINASGAAIYVSKGSNVTNNILRNVTGVGVEVGSSNIFIGDNEINVSGYGIHAIGNMSGVVISNNIIDSVNSTIKLEKKSRILYPHDFIIQNNTLNSDNPDVINVDSACTNILMANNIGYEGSGQSGDEETVHYIIETNFYNYFSLTGNLESNVKENDTLIFMNSFTSKGKLYINNKVKIQGVNAVFNDTTFIIDDNDVVIENITISNPNLNNMDRLWGIQVNGVNNVTIQNCSISIYDPYSAYAIYLLEASNCTIVNNTLEARGNYFTVAVLSFNSHNIFLDGNILNTVGCGETYLINNKSCLDGYLNVYADTCVDGTIVCPDGYTICPDGSLLCPDGVTTIAAEDYRICVDGSIVCVDGTIICADGTTISYADSDICPDGSVCVDGTTYCLDGTILYADGSKKVAGGYIICVDGSIVCPDGAVLSSDNYEICADGSIACPDGTVICTDGSIICPDGSTLCPDGSIICADGTTICPDGNVICADGTVVCPDGSVVCPDGTIYGPGEYTTCVDGSIVCPDGTVICPDGTIICADGTTICPDGSGSSTILDGVIPGSHMVSGVYRTYGFLMIHSSNITFTNNNVSVGSALGEDYDLNESFNTIAGVFIHYGGFNNNISNNNIVLASNDPIIYGIGIIGAPMGSTAVGSLNNTFTCNNVSINGTYLTVGLLLGNKVFESSIDYNNFNIISGRESPNIVNYNATANNTIGENNVFDSTLSTLFSYENITVTIQEANENTIVFRVVFKDKEGNALANKDIKLIFNSTENNFTTDENGAAALVLDLKEVGTYDILMSFAGDEKYFASSALGTVTVRKFIPSLTVSNVSYKTTDGNKVLTATLKDEDGLALANKTIIFNVNGKNYTATTNEKGIATAKISLTAGGTYLISASFAGNDEFDAKASSAKLTLTKQTTSLTSPNRNFIVTNTAKYIYVTLRDGAKKLLTGKKITAVVNGKTFSAKTNSKGVAKIKLTLTAVKTFRVNLKFAGDSTYSASTKAITVKVTKTKTKLAVPNKTYKKTAKAKKLTATLRDQTGKIVKSKKVVFTVNGKKYSAKTNSKGIATVNVKLTAKKTYKFTVKFAGDSKYYAVTKAAKVVIK